LSTSLPRRSIELFFALRRAFSKIVHIVIPTTADAGIVLCKKPFPANLASSYRSQTPIKGNVNDRLDNLELGIPSIPNTPPAWQFKTLSGGGLDAMNR
jgi:hypothetical protein